MLLAGDVGGTKALVGLFLGGPGRPELVDARAFATRDYAGLEAVVEAFLAAQPSPVPPLTAASFGVAGPIVDQVARLTNVPWRRGRVGRRLPVQHPERHAPERSPGDGVLRRGAGTGRTGRRAGGPRRADRERGADRRGHRAWRGAAPLRGRSLHPVAHRGRPRRFRAAHGGRGRAAPASRRALRPGRLRARDLGPRALPHPPLHAPGRVRRLRCRGRPGRGAFANLRGGARATVPVMRPRAGDLRVGLRRRGRQPRAALRRDGGRLRRRRHRAEDPAGAPGRPLHRGVPREGPDGGVPVAHARRR